jgi:hypothetical protein
MARARGTLVVTGVRLNGPACHLLTEGKPVAMARLIREFVRRTTVGKQERERG